MEAIGKTIQIYLPTGNPNSIRIAELTTRIVQAIVVPRARIKEAGNRDELKGVGLYFLVGDTDDQVKPVVYVGEAEDCYTRLGQHNSQKDFWTAAIVIISRTASFTKAHVKYLEWYCIDKIAQIGRFKLENSVKPTEPFIPEPMQADLRDVIDTFSVLVSALGFNFFQPIRSVEKTEAIVDPVSEVESEEQTRKVFSYQTFDALGSGEMTEEGFVVFKDSFASVNERPSTAESVKNLRRKLIEENILRLTDDKLVFQQDYIFKSPSAAAQVLRGHNVNGWNVWKDTEGRTLDDIYRKP